MRVSSPPPLCVTPADLEAGSFSKYLDRTFGLHAAGVSGDEAGTLRPSSVRGGGGACGVGCRASESTHACDALVKMGRTSRGKQRTGGDQRPAEHGKFPPGRPCRRGGHRDLLEAAMNAPSAINEQAWQFVVLSGKALVNYLKINSNTPRAPPWRSWSARTSRSRRQRATRSRTARRPRRTSSWRRTPRGSVPSDHVFPANVEAVRRLLGFRTPSAPFSCVPLGRPAGPAPRRRAGSTRPKCTARRGAAAEGGAGALTARR